MKTKLKNTVNYLKKNKKKVFIVAGCVIGGVIVFAISKQKPKIFDDLNITGDQKPILFGVPKHIDGDIDIGNVMEAVEYQDGTIELMMDKIPLTELGNFGEKLASKHSLNIGETEVWTLMNIKENNN